MKTQIIDLPRSEAQDFEREVERIIGEQVQEVKESTVAHIMGQCAISNASFLEYLQQDLLPRSIGVEVQGQGVYDPHENSKQTLERKLHPQIVESEELCFARTILEAYRNIVEKGNDTDFNDLENLERTLEQTRGEYQTLTQKIVKPEDHAPQGVDKNTTQRLRKEWEKEVGKYHGLCGNKKRLEKKIKELEGRVKNVGENYSAFFGAAQVIAKQRGFTALADSLELSVRRYSKGRKKRKEYGPSLIQTRELEEFDLPEPRTIQWVVEEQITKDAREHDENVQYKEYPLKHQRKGGKEGRKRDFQGSVERAMQKAYHGLRAASLLGVMVAGTLLLASDVSQVSENLPAPHSPPAQSSQETRLVQNLSPNYQDDAIIVYHQDNKTVRIYDPCPWPIIPKVVDGVQTGSTLFKLPLLTDYEKFISQREGGEAYFRSATGQLHHSPLNECGILDVDNDVYLYSLVLASCMSNTQVSQMGIGRDGFRQALGILSGDFVGVGLTVNHSFLSQDPAAANFKIKHPLNGEVAISISQGAYWMADNGPEFVMYLPREYRSHNLDIYLEFESMKPALGCYNGVYPLGSTSSFQTASRR